MSPAIRRTIFGALVAFGAGLPGIASAVPYDMNISGAGLSLSYTDLRLGSDIRDWYKGTATANGTLTVDVLFTDANGDIDVILYDSSATTQLDSGASVSDNEQVSAFLSAGEMFFIEVYLFGMLGTGTADTDLFDPNDTSAAATVLMAIPEPATLALFGLGLAGLGVTRRRSLKSRETNS